MQESFILEDLLNVLIHLETTGNQMYTELSKRAEDPKTTELFSLLAAQEMKHKRIYEGFKKTLQVHEQIDQDYVAYLEVLLKENIHFLDVETTPEDNREAICLSVQLEKDTILFLMEMQKILLPEYKAQVDDLIDEERKHLQYLYEYQRASVDPS